MSKMYEANAELEEILKKHGFIETTSERDKQKGKKSFKLSKMARKEIYFDYINIKIINSIHVDDHIISMDEKELKLMLLYFKLEARDFKELSPNGIFNFLQVEKELTQLYKELESLKEFDIQKKRQAKLSRILNIYESITL